MATSRDNSRLDMEVRNGGSVRIASAILLHLGLFSDAILAALIAASAFPRRGFFVKHGKPMTKGSLPDDGSVTTIPASLGNPAPPRRHNPWMTFLISFSAAICMAGGFAIMGLAFVFASAVLFDFSYILVWSVNGIIGIAALWGFVWVFSRSWHVERRLAGGAEIDEPKASIIENWRE